MEQRKIAFRAWDKTDKQIWSSERLGEVGVMLADIGRSERFEFMQFTGLHDKNGKEIYEGDVVMYGADGMRDQISWNATKGRWNWAVWGLTAPEALKLSVIGNIYENLELISTP
jgi:hypothetical protein